jgi:hypothetical protein
LVLTVAFTTLNKHITEPQRAAAERAMRDFEKRNSA